MNMDNNNLPEKCNALDENTKRLAGEIIEEENIDKIKDLTVLFNLNMSKKNVTRLMKLNDLLDSVSDQMAKRLENRSDEFSNNDLITYMKVIQDSMDKSSKSLNQVDETPAISINNTKNEVNIAITDGVTLDRNSKERVLDAVKAYLSRVKSESNDNIVYTYDKNEQDGE